MTGSMTGGGGSSATGTSNVADPTGADWQQPPFDPRITYTPLLQYDAVGASGALSHGYIREATTGGGMPGSARYVRFLYNPSTISVSHGISTSDASYDPSLRPTTDDGVVVWPTGATVSFDLLFDRTYETSDTGRFSRTSTDSFSRGAELGVQVDINALYAICGILQTRQGAPLTHASSGPTTRAGKAELIAQTYIRSLSDDKLPDFLRQDKFVTQETIHKLNKDRFSLLIAAQIATQLTDANLSLSDLPTTEDPSILTDTTPNAPSDANTAPSTGYGYGYMTIKEIVAVIGEQRGSSSGVLRYYGYINSLNITYTHFTQRMVPVRASVSLSIALLPADSSQLDQLTGVG